MKLKSHFGTAASASLLTIGLIVGATVSATSANAQTSYYWGNTQLDDAVSVNLNVLETLGEAPNLPGLLSSRARPAPKPMVMPSSVSNSQAPRISTSANASSFPSSGLTNMATTSGMPTSGLVSSMPKASISAPTPVASPTPAPTSVKAPVKKQEAKIKTPVPAPTPQPAPKAAEIKKEAPKVAKATQSVAKPIVTPAPVTAPTPAIPASKLVKDTEKKVEAKVAKAEIKAVAAPATIPAAPKVEKKVQPLVSVTPKPVPEAAPALAPAPKKSKPVVKKAEPQVASVPKVADPKIVKTEGDVIRILFNETATDVPGGAKPALDDLVKMMQENENMGLQLEGYANIPNASPNQSRRMSLFRAISVRNYLVKHEIQSRRIEVRALGNKSDDASADRVDVFIKN